MGRNAIKTNPWDAPGDPNKTVILQYLGEIQNNNSRINQMKQLRWCFQTLYTLFGVKQLKMYSYNELKRILMEVDKNSIRENTKYRYMNVMRQLIDTDREAYIGENLFYSDVKYDFLFNKKRLNQGSGFKDGAKKKNTLKITIDEWIQFILDVRHHPAQTEKDKEVLFRLFFSSCRIKALVNIQVHNINFNLRYFDTPDKVVGNRVEKFSRYFFPEDLKPLLLWYIEKYSLRAVPMCPCKKTLQTNPDTLELYCPECKQIYWDYLFPSPNHLKAPNEHLSDKTVRSWIRHYRPKWHPHSFRHAIKYLWKKAGMDVVDRMVLANQSAPDKDDEDIKVDAIYSSEDAFLKPNACLAIYDKYYLKVMSTATLKL